MALATAQRTFEMLENQTLWETATRVHEVLSLAGIDHAVVGGVAVCLHGYRRNTVDLDLLVRLDDSNAIRTVLDSENVRFVMAGASEGSGQSAVFPDPADASQLTHIEGLPVLSLAALIQSKLACGLGNLRRTHKDFADVVELIAIHRLHSSFARLLHKSVQPEFRTLVKHATS